MKNHEKFLGLYNDLDDILRKKYHNNDRTSSMMIKFMNDLNHTGTQAYIQIAKKLNMIRIIRNNLIHELDMNKDNLIEITDDSIKFLEEVIRLLEHPKTAKDIAKPINLAFIVRNYSEVKLTDLIKKMRERGFSQVPLLDDKNVLQGVFSPNVLFGYVSNNPNVDISSITLKDIEDLCAISKHFSETYLFIPKGMVEEEIDDLYTNNLTENKKPAMLFVTKNGKESEPIEGIIVLKDLLNASLDSPIFKN